MLFDGGRGSCFFSRGSTESEGLDYAFLASTSQGEISQGDVADGHANWDGDNAFLSMVAGGFFAGDHVPDGRVHGWKAARKFGVLFAAVIGSPEGDFLEVLHEGDIIDDEFFGLMKGCGGVGAAAFDADAESAGFEPFFANDLLVTICAGGNDVGADECLQCGVANGDASVKVGVGASLFCEGGGRAGTDVEEANLADVWK